MYIFHKSAYVLCFQILIKKGVSRKFTVDILQRFSFLQLPLSTWLKRRSTFFLLFLMLELHHDWVFCWSAFFLLNIFYRKLCWCWNIFVWKLRRFIIKFDWKDHFWDDLIRVLSADAEGCIFAPVVRVLLLYAECVPSGV